MFDPGEELTLASSGIPWLIWIQLIVLFLLIALIYCFTLFALDSSDDASTVTAATATEGPTTAESPSSSRFLFDDIQQVEKPGAKHDSEPSTFVINRRQNTQVGENRSIKGEVSAGTSRRVVSGGEFAEREGSSRFHPCHYFQLAGVAFLKCLGLDPTCDIPPTQKRRKPKES